MSITRINEFRARPGQGEALRDAISLFLPVIESSMGCRSCRLLQHLDDPDRIVVVEVWDSVEAHRASLQNIPSSMMEEAMTLLADAPRGSYYHG